MNPNDQRLYQAEVARRTKEGMPDGEPPSFLGEVIGVVDAFYDAAGDPSSTEKILVDDDACEGSNINRIFKVPHHATACEEPPRKAEWIVAFFLSARMGESVLGDLHEIFVNYCKLGSCRRARQLFWFRAMRSVFDAVGPIIIKKLSSWGAIAALVELGRRPLP